MRRTVRLLAIAATMTVLAVSAPVQGVEPTGASTTVRVRMADFRFRPASISIERGTVVRWKNVGDAAHTSTSNSGIWDSGNVSPGETFRRRFRRAGTFGYRCTIHPSMTGTITVT